MKPIFLLSFVLLICSSAFSQDIPHISVSNPADTPIIHNAKPYVFKYIVKHADKFDKTLVWSMKQPVKKATLYLSPLFNSDSSVSLNAIISKSDVGCFETNSFVDFLFTDGSTFKAFNSAAYNCKGNVLIYLTKYNDYRIKPFILLLTTQYIKAIRFRGTNNEYNAELTHSESLNIQQSLVEMFKINSTN